MAKGPKMNTIDWIAWLVVVVGAVNWGFIGVANLNLVQSIFGATGSLIQFVNILIGLGGLYMIWKALAK